MKNPRTRGGGWREMGIYNRVISGTGSGCKVASGERWGCAGGGMIEGEGRGGEGGGRGHDRQLPLVLLLHFQSVAAREGCWFGGGR